MMASLKEVQNSSCTLKKISRLGETKELEERANGVLLRVNRGSIHVVGIPCQAVLVTNHHIIPDSRGAIGWRVCYAGGDKEFEIKEENIMRCVSCCGGKCTGKYCASREYCGSQFCGRTHCLCGTYAHKCCGGGDSCYCHAYEDDHDACAQDQGGCCECFCCGGELELCGRMCHGGIHREKFKCRGKCCECMCCGDERCGNMCCENDSDNPCECCTGEGMMGQKKHHRHHCPFNLDCTLVFLSSFDDTHTEHLQNIASIKCVQYHSLELLQIFSVNSGANVKLEYFKDHNFVPLKVDRLKLQIAKLNKQKFQLYWLVSFFHCSNKELGYGDSGVEIWSLKNDGTRTLVGIHTECYKKRQYNTFVPWIFLLASFINPGYHPRNSTLLAVVYFIITELIGDQWKHLCQGNIFDKLCTIIDNFEGLDLNKTENCQKTLHYLLSELLGNWRYGKVTKVHLSICDGEVTYIATDNGDAPKNSAAQV